MGCILAIIALGFPRLVILLLFLFSDFLARAYATAIWPVLGFLFMPMTTLAYAWSKNTYGDVQGLGLVALILAVLLDLGLFSFSGKAGLAKRHRD